MAGPGWIIESDELNAPGERFLAVCGGWRWTPDPAQAHEARHLAAALAALARPRSTEPQLVQNGKVVCLDCDNPVPPARLADIPGACRCTFCQEAHDAKEGRHG